MHKRKSPNFRSGFRAEDEARTRDNQLGRLELYQLSYFRISGCKYKPTFCGCKFFLKFSPPNIASQ